MTKREKARKSGWIKAAAVLLIAVLACLTAAAVSMVFFSKTDETKKADAAIVLGASVCDNSPSPVFSERINHAVDLYNDGYVDAIIMTGGTGKGNIRSEADIAGEYAEKKGIPAEAVFMEEDSSVTEENLVNAGKVMSENGMDTALIVSDPLHMKRAMLYAKDLNMTAYSSPTPTTMYRSWNTRLPFLIRETIYYSGYRLARLFRHKPAQP